MANIERPKGTVCDETVAEAQVASPAERGAFAEAEQLDDDPDNYFWGINELYVAP